MSATYSASLSTDLDWVRFLIADTNVVTPQFQDEEILAVIAEESGGVAAAAALKYVAAARLLSMLHSCQSSTYLMRSRMSVLVVLDVVAMATLVERRTTLEWRSCSPDVITSSVRHRFRRRRRREIPLRR